MSKKSCEGCVESIRLSLEMARRSKYKTQYGINCWKCNKVLTVVVEERSK